MKYKVKEVEYVMQPSKNSRTVIYTKGKNTLQINIDNYGVMFNKNLKGFNFDIMMNKSNIYSSFNCIDEVLLYLGWKRKGNWKQIVKRIKEILEIK